MPLRIGQGQGRPPGAAEQHPLLDAQVLTQSLDVLDQVPGGVVFQAGIGRGATAAALVEGDDAIEVGIEEAPTQAIAAGTRPAMEEQHRQAVGRAALIGVEYMGRFDGQLVAGIGLDFRVQIQHVALRRAGSASSS